MKAVIYDSAGFLGMRFKSDAPKPSEKPGAGQVLIRPSAAAINPVDYKLGTMAVVRTFLSGTGVGLDVSGTVVAAAEGTGFTPGQAVYGFGKGTLSELLLAPAAELAPKPPSLTHAEAASLPTVFLTALQAYKRNALAAGQQLLVIGASGGVGSAGVQIGKAMGAVVTGICSGANAPLVRSLGADRVVDYNNASEVDALGSAEDGKFDLVFDTVTSQEDTDYETKLRHKVLKPGGRYVAINSTSAFDFIRSLASKSTGWNLQRGGYDLVVTDHNRADLDTLSGWIAEGKLRPVMHGPPFPFTEAGVQEAFTILKSRRAKGKLVVDINGAGER